MGRSNEFYGRDQQRNSGNAETNQHTKSWEDSSRQKADCLIKRTNKTLGSRPMNHKQILFEERFKFNLELLDFPEENTIGWRLALEMTEEDINWSVLNAVA